MFFFGKSRFSQSWVYGIVQCKVQRQWLTFLAFEMIKVETCYFLQRRIQLCFKLCFCILTFDFLCLGWVSSSLKLLTSGVVAFLVLSSNPLTSSNSCDILRTGIVRRIVFIASVPSVENSVFFINQIVIVVPASDHTVPLKYKTHKF